MKSKIIVKPKKLKKVSMGFFLHFLFFLPFLAIVAESDDSLGTYCNTNITSKNVSSNINNLLPILVKGTIATGYIATSYGKGNDQVYGLAQCRADVGTKDCSSCVQSAAKQILEKCPNQADAQIWYDYCFLRYATQDFIGKVDTSYALFYYNVENVTDPKTFDKKLGDLMDSITNQATLPGNYKEYGSGKSKLSDFQTLYALVQCTRDLSPLSCSQCLAIAIGNFPNFCNEKQGCRGLYSNCYVRYELYPFYFPLSPGEKMSRASMASYKTLLVRP